MQKGPRKASRDSAHNKGDARTGRAPHAGSSKGRSAAQDRERKPDRGRARNDTRPAPVNERSRSRGVEPNRAIALQTKPSSPVRIEEGLWLWTTRPDADPDLLDELNGQLSGKGNARRHSPSIVLSDGAPAFQDGDIDTTFARQGFRVAEEFRVADASMLAEALHAHLEKSLESHTNGLAVSVFTPDSDATNQYVALADNLLDDLLALPNTFPVSEARARGLSIAHVAVCNERNAFVGYSTPITTVSYAEGGRARMRVAGGKPSRAARKVEEALFWLNMSPGAGEVCIDMGAAPGGWSWSLLEKRCRVIAIDPAELRPDIAKHARLQHIKASAFAYAPDEPVDWLFGDMAWRPLEVAEMAAKWGRKRWARFLVMNFKLPMKRKWEMVDKIRQTLALGGWKRVRTRQLYHDRDEITVTAHL